MKNNKFENNPACDGTWAEHRKRLFTPEEIAESDQRVARASVEIQSRKKTE